MAEALLAEPVPASLLGTEIDIRLHWLRASRASDASDSLTLLTRAAELARVRNDETLLNQTRYRQASALLAMGKNDEAASQLEPVIAWARRTGESRWLRSSLINLSVVRIRQDRYDETIAMNLEAATVADSPPRVRAAIEINLGWSYLQLGHDELAVKHLTSAADLFRQSGAPARESDVYRNLTLYYLKRNDLEAANRSMGQAIDAANGLPDADRAPAWADLAEVAVMQGLADRAEEALAEAKLCSGYRAGTLRSSDDAHIRFVEGWIADSRSQAAAEAAYREVARSTVARRSLALEAATRLGGWLGRNHRPDQAEAQYQAAEALLEEMRRRLTQDESKMSFFDDASALFTAHIELLLSRGKNIEALRVADSSRARLLSEYGETGLQPLDLDRLRQRLGDSLALFYWLGKERTSLWIISRDGVEQTPLAAKPDEIRQIAQAFFHETSRLRGDTRETGARLRTLLLGPAQKHLRPGRRIVMLLDDKLSLINPEALPGDKGGWWLEDAVVSVAPSLALLERQNGVQVPSAEPTLLALGNAEPASQEFPRLRNASAELDAVAGQFPLARRTVIQGAQATPAAYRASQPARFDFIHFTAHGEANADNPLDSSVVLSKDRESGSFKLYARQIVTERIQSRLVTISACRSAFSRSYRGEGPVGLSWAFLRAGARQVVAGLWNVDDEASGILMRDFYANLAGGQSAAGALREAKRHLVQLGYKSPYYWAPFELFSGAVEDLR